MIDLDKHLASCSPEYDVYTFNFTLAEVEGIKDALNKKDWVTEVRELLKEVENG